MSALAFVALSQDQLAAIYTNCEIFLIVKAARAVCNIMTNEEDVQNHVMFLELFCLVR